MDDRIVTGQHVKAEKLDSAKQLRKEQTPEEDLLWQRLRRSQLRGLHFRRQQVVHGYIADFYCHSADLVIEVDGPVHITRVEEDAYRDEVLRSHGLTVAHVSNADVRADIEAVLVRILELATKRVPPSH